MSNASLAAAENFIANETEFHLGFLPTEQSNPATATMEADFAADTCRGVMTIRKADRPVLEMAKKVLKSSEFAKLVDAGVATLADHGRIIFSGCGATGRLSILLEAMFREFAANHRDQLDPDSSESIMTGGDFALIRSVEFFEDFQIFGRKQVKMAKMGERDMLVAITEGGETSSVIGTVKEAVKRGCRTFIMFNNPADLLRDHLIRCREVIDDPAVTVLDLSCGPMTLAGSTRMQATTSEELIAGAFLETLISRQLGLPTPDFAKLFAELLDQLESDAEVKKIAAAIDHESEIYRHGGKVTYYANSYLLDLFTDTTERNPTFMLPPFRSKDLPDAPQSWAFVKNPLFDTVNTWRNMLKRSPRCLDWTPADYEAMGTAKEIGGKPPKISEKDLYRIEVGNEPAPERFAGEFDRKVTVFVAGAEGNEQLFAAAPKPDWVIEITAGSSDSPLKLMKHLAVKLVLNTISTGTMAKIGRVSGNWMSFVSVSNKKLIDRAIRLISELGKCDYHTACVELFASIEELQNMPKNETEELSPVQYTLAKLRRK